MVFRALITERAKVLDRGLTIKEQKKKILVVCQHFWPEAFRINDICDYLVESDCEIEVLCGIPNYPQGKFFEGYSYLKNRRQEHQGMHIRRAFEIPRGSNTNIRIFLNYVSFPLSSLSHIPRLLTKKYDKIFLYQLSPVMMSLAGIIVGRVKKIETTMYVLDLWPENLYSVIEVKNRFLRNLARSVSRWHYRKVDKIATISQKMKEQMHVITGLPDEKIIFVPQCCEKLYEKDIHDDELSRKYGTGFNIVFAGNISPAQSFETVVDAAKQLKRNGIDDIHWIIVGDGMSRKWLEDTVRTEGLKENFSFEGFIPVTEIPKFHTVADALLACLVKSDLLECTIPAKVMSYFAAGRPMLLAMDGEAQRLVKDIGCGFACGSGDSTTLYENIMTLYHTPRDQRELMGERGREYHFKHFERDANMEKLHRFLFDEEGTSASVEPVLHGPAEE